MVNLQPNSNGLTASSLVIRIFCLLTVGHFLFCWLCGLFALAQFPSDKYLHDDIEGQRRSIARRLKDGGAYWQHVFQPEGALFTYAFYGYALVSLAAREPQNLDLRRDVLTELEKLIPESEAAINQYPFNYCSGMNPRGGVIAAGNVNLLRAGYALLGGENSRIIERFHKGSRELSESYSQLKSPVLASFPSMSEVWPVDNCAAVESLRLHDKLYASSYFSATERYRNFVASFIDPESKMMNAGANAAQQRSDVPRGCALTWSLAFMPGCQSGLCAAQYAALRRSWIVPVLGAVGIREWWPGQEKYSHIKEGPVVLGIGAAASGLGIGMSRVHDDRQVWLGLLRGLELITFPSWNFRGEKSYFGDCFLMADAIALWGKTACVWDQPEPLDNWSRESILEKRDFHLGLFWIPLSLAVLISVLLFTYLSWLCYGSLQSMRTKGLATPKPHASGTIQFAGMDAEELSWGTVQVLLAVLYLFLPAFTWIEAVLLMSILRFVEKWQAKVKGLRTL